MLLPSARLKLSLRLCLLVPTLLGARAEDRRALSIPPSQYWEGVDGLWSTFLIQVGTPGQAVRLLPGTSANAGSSIWTVIPQGCSLENPGLVDCVDNRGNVFRSNESTTWSTEGLGNGPSGVLYQLLTVVESMLGLKGNAYYGYDTVSLGLPGSGLPTIDHTLVAGIATNDFWLGSLGLSPLPFNFTNFNHPIPSLLSTLRTQSIIPSTSWAYTAGAHYKDPPVFGSLTLGGFDRNRSPGAAPNLTTAFGTDISKDLLVTLDSITYNSAGSSPLLAESISIFIDSMVTDLWLPVSVCNEIAQQLGLTWNSTLQSYLVDGDAHGALVAQNPVLTFSLSNPNGNGTIDIVLPYAAFDLEMRAPLVDMPTKYFPIKQAHNETQYVLGRTFLQEAYIVADYDRQQFSISQAAFPGGAGSEELATIYPPDYRNDSSIRTNEREGGLSGGVIASIVLGAASFACLVAVTIWLVRRRKWRFGLGGSNGAVGTPVMAEKRGGEAGQAETYMTERSTPNLSELDAHDFWSTQPKRHTALKRTSELDGTHYSREMASPEPVVAELEAQSLR